MRLITIMMVLCGALALPAFAQPETEPRIGIDPMSAPSDLQIGLLPFRLDRLEALADQWMEELESSAQDVARTLVEHGQAADFAASGTPDAALVAEGLAVRLGEQRDRLAIRARSMSAVLDAINAKGGDAASRRAYVTALARLITPAATATPGPPATDLAARVEAEARRVRNEPAAHERAEPWAVPLEELQNELQPLRRTQIEEQVQIWLDLLQQQVRERNRLNIAAEQSKDDAFRQALLDRAQQKQATINALVARIEVVLTVAQRRGSDVAEARQYVTNTTGVRFNLTDPKVLTAQALAWVRSADGGIAVGMRIVWFAVLLVGFWLVARLIGGVARSAVKRMPNSSSLLEDFSASIVRRLVFLVGLIVAVSQLGVNISPLLAAIGAAGLVIGLALQGTLSNFASGLLILLYRPFDVGDFINAGGVSGKVEAMNLVTTRIGTFDNQVMHVPNNGIWNNVITNINGRSTRRVDMKFGIAYSADMAKAEAVIREIIAGHDKVLATPEPVIKVHELADNSVNFIVRPWSLVADYWDVYWDVTRKIKERFDADGIGIPFPQRDLHMPGPIEVVVRNT